MTAPFPDLRTAARLLGGDIDKDGQINCPGPHHSRADRSLRVKLDPSKPNGFSVHSRAGDDWKACQDYVADKFGLDRWEQPETAEDMIERTAARVRQTRANGNGACHDSGAAEKPWILTEYVYNDALGELYARVIWYEPKEFRQQHWNGTGWSWGKHKGPKLPYRLPEMLEAVGDEVFVVEGEMDADALAALGFVVTSASEGAGKWTPDLNDWFKGRIVHILADNDDPGRDHAWKVAENLHGIAAEVRVSSCRVCP
jgi:hypothetical protein